MKRMKVVLLIAFAMVSIVFMVQFKNNHSAKERLREAGIRYYRMGWYDDADECFALALKQEEAFDDASDRDIYYYLADGEMKQKDYSSAIKYYEKLIEIGEDSKDLYGNLGICYHLQGKDDMCYDYLKKAAKAEDSDSSIIYTLMIACQNLGKFDEAKEYAAKGYKLAKSTLSPDAKSMLKSSKGGTVTSKLAGELKEYGTFAYLTGESKTSYRCFEILYKNGDEEVIPYLASCKADQCEYEEALKMIKSYEANHEANALCDAKTVYCNIQLGNYADALNDIDKAMAYENQGCLRELLYEKGVALEYTGDFNGAYDCFKEYIDKYGEDDTVKREYEFLLTRIT